MNLGKSGKVGGKGFGIFGKGGGLGVMNLGVNKKPKKNPLTMLFNGKKLKFK